VNQLTELFAPCDLLWLSWLQFKRIFENSWNEELRVELIRKLLGFCSAPLKTIQIALVVIVMTLSGASAQTNNEQNATNKLPSADMEKIADALRAGPSFITKDATILDWPSTKGGEYRVLRKGTNEWTCLPAFPGYSHDEPGCFDLAFMNWVKQSLAGEEPHIDRIGIAYMYVGAWVPNASGKASASTPEFHVGPHIMIVSPHENQKELESFSHDGSNGMPYVAHLPGGKDLYLVMPFQQANKH
jgi:hypothetical protein